MRVIVIAILPMPWMNILPHFLYISVTHLPLTACYQPISPIFLHFISLLCDVKLLPWHYSTWAFVVGLALRQQILFINSYMSLQFRFVTTSGLMRDLSFSYCWTLQSIKDTVIPHSSYQQGGRCGQVAGKEHSRKSWPSWPKRYSFTMWGHAQQ